MAASTTATAGAPGTFDGDVPPTKADLQRLTASPTTAWKATEYVKIGSGNDYSWDGSAWQAWSAPSAGTGTSTGGSAKADPVVDTSAETTTLTSNSGLAYDACATGADIDGDGNPDAGYPHRLKYGEQMQYSLDQLSTR